MGTVGPTRSLTRAASAPETPPLMGFARRQLAAADVLLGQGMTTAALGLLAQAMFAQVTARAGRGAVPEGEGAAAWLFGEAVPQGHAPMGVANAILCAPSLAHAEAVPEGLVTDLMGRARDFIGP
jgi:hypothetical protein